MGYSKFGLKPKDILPFVRNLRSTAEFVKTKCKINAVDADPTDNIFLECAVDGKADYIISGDRHLLDLGFYKRIKIIRPGDSLHRNKLFFYSTCKG